MPFEYIRHVVNSLPGRYSQRFDGLKSSYADQPSEVLRRMAACKITRQSPSPEHTSTLSDPMEKMILKREPLMTTAAVAKWFGISTRAICLWAECKELPAIKVGRQWRFRPDELSDWLQSPRAEKVKNDPKLKSAVAGV